MSGEALRRRGVRTVMNQIRTLARGLSVFMTAALLFTGCQTFRPVTPTALEQGSVVRLDLAERSSIDLREMTAHGITRLRGETISVNQDQLAISVLWLERPGGAGFEGEGWTVTIPLNRIQRLEQQHLDTWRTTGLVAAAAAATIIGWEALGGGEDQPGGEGNGTTVE